MFATANKIATQLLREAQQAEKLRPENAALEQKLFELQNVHADNDRLRADVQVIQNLKVENAKLKGKSAGKSEARADPALSEELASKEASFTAADATIDGTKIRKGKKRSERPIAVSAAAESVLTSEKTGRPAAVIETIKNTVTEQGKKQGEDSLQSIRNITAATLMTMPTHSVHEGKDWRPSGRVDTANAKIVELNKNSIDERYPLKKDATAEEFEEQAVQVTRRIEARCQGSLTDVGKLRGSPAEGLQLQVRMEAMLRRLIEGVVEDIEKVLAVKGLH